MQYFKFFFALFIALSFVICHDSKAEFYNYTDDSGIIHYTDDYSSIPEKHKKNITRNKEIKTPVQDLDDKIGNNDEKSKVSPSEKVAKLKLEKEKLAERKKEITSLFENVEKRRKELNKIRKSIKTKSEGDKYNAEIKKFKKMVASYEEKVEKLNKDVEIFNSKIKDPIRNK